MKYLYALLIAALLWPCTTFSQAEPDSTAATAPSFESAYAPLRTNNLFLRERRAPRPEVQEAPPPPPAVPEKDWRLTGIVYEDHGFRAYFENLRSGEVLRTSTGDPIARGHIADIYIDAVGFLKDQQLVWIDFGQDLTGNAAAVPSRAAATASVSGTSTPPPGTPAAAPATPGTADAPSSGEAGLSLREQMRRRAAAERGGS